jgi:hypothetical protein
MRFSGRQVDVLRGFPPRWKPVHWLGAAVFLFDGPRLRRLGCVVTCSGLRQFSMHIRFQNIHMQPPRRVLLSAQG